MNEATKERWGLIAVIIGLGAFFAFAGENALDTRGRVFFMAYLFGTWFGWTGCRISYKTDEQQKKLEELQEELDESQGELLVAQADLEDAQADLEELRGY